MSAVDGRGRDEIEISNLIGTRCWWGRPQFIVNEADVVRPTTKQLQRRKRRKMWAIKSSKSVLHYANALKKANTRNCFDDANVRSLVSETNYERITRVDTYDRPTDIASLMHNSKQHKTKCQTSEHNDDENAWKLTKREKRHTNCSRRTNSVYCWNIFLHR